MRYVRTQTEREAGISALKDALKFFKESEWDICIAYMNDVFDCIDRLKGLANEERDEADVL